MLTLAYCSSTCHSTVIDSISYPLCVREIKLPTTDHPSFKALVGARPVAAAMASDSAHPASTSGGGRDEETDAPDDDPADMVEIELFHDPVAAAADDDPPGVTAPVKEEAEPAAPARPLVTISDRGWSATHSLTLYPPGRTQELVITQG